jgi:hypothetical protein
MGESAIWSISCKHDATAPVAEGRHSGKAKAELKTLRATVEAAEDSDGAGGDMAAVDGAVAALHV